MAEGHVLSIQQAIDCIAAYDKDDHSTCGASNIRMENNCVRPDMVSTDPQECVAEFRKLFGGKYPDGVFNDAMAKLFCDEQMLPINDDTSKIDLSIFRSK